MINQQIKPPKVIHMNNNCQKNKIYNGIMSKIINYKIHFYNMILIKIIIKFK
jgi:hypothetical protein